MGNKGIMKDPKWTDEKNQCERLAPLAEKEHSLAWRVFHYLRRHLELLEKYQNAYAVTEYIQLIKLADGKMTVEEAEKCVEFLADLFNAHPQGEEFIPTKKQLKHFNSFPVPAETFMQSVKILFVHASEKADDGKEKVRITK